jgi:signal peptidase I
MGWIIFLLGTIGFHAGLYGLFKKAGLKEWQALVPFYNTWIMVDAMQKKKRWFWLQLIPIAGQFLTLSLVIDFVKHFGKFTLWEHALTVFLPFAYLPYLGFAKDTRYIGPEGVKLYKKSSIREWVDAAVFAIVAATIIRTFVFEAYTIPTPSMEKTLLVNDFLFVSKFSYGPRIPNTPLSFPFVHHTMPFFGGKSYLEWIKLPYQRLLASPVKRNDIVVFNLPVGDTVINDEINYGSRVTYYQALRDANGNRDSIWNEFGSIIITRPVDKRENFIKRCVAIAGDTLEVRNGVVYINGKLNDIPAGLETNYLLETKGQPLDMDELKETYDISQEEGEVRYLGGNQYEIFLTKEQVAVFSKLSYVQSLMPVNFTYPNCPPGLGGADVFPNDTAYAKWTIDNYGPLYIPAKGGTIQLNAQTYPRYERVIRTYEGNNFEVKNGKYILNDKEVSSYTFKQDYFWLMGDNRHNSLDSRYWGFVPEDHVVGKASMIFFSYENGPRWKRIFRLIH